jgi:hypothetical protein
VPFISPTCRSFTDASAHGAPVSTAALAEQFMFLS